jgi:hypothetical protein
MSAKLEQAPLRRTAKPRIFEVQPRLPMVGCRPALMIGHHFTLSILWNAANASSRSEIVFLSPSTGNLPKHADVADGSTTPVPVKVTIERPLRENAGQLPIETPNDRWPL